MNAPNDRCLDHELAVLVDSLEHLGRLLGLLRLDRHVQVHTDLLALEPGVEVKLLVVIRHEDLGLDQQCKDLAQDLLRDGGRRLQLVQRQRVRVVVLRQDRHLVAARHQDVLLVEVVGTELVLQTWSASIPANKICDAPWSSSTAM